MALTNNKYLYNYYVKQLVDKYMILEQQKTKKLWHEIVNECLSLLIMKQGIKSHSQVITSHFHLYKFTVDCPNKN